MWTVTKRMEIAGAHKLDLPYPSKCSEMHGHNWIIWVEVSTDVLNAEGMVVDFGWLKNEMEGYIKEPFDHQVINTKLGNHLNPTAENIAVYIWNEMTNGIASLRAEMQTNKLKEAIQTGKIKTLSQDLRITKVTVQESEGNVTCYIP